MSVSEYQILEKMASGAFGIVFKVRRITDHRIFVMKRIPLLDLEPEQRHDAAQEVAVMRDLHHPCVVAQKDAFLYNQYDLCLILEYYDGGDMDSRMAEQREHDTYFSFNQVMLWFVQLVLGAQYLHAHRVVHRDIKTHNVFLRGKDNSVALGDFGISERLSSGAADAASHTWTAATMGGGGGHVHGGGEGRQPSWDSSSVEGMGGGGAGEPLYGTPLPMGAPYSPSSVSGRPTSGGGGLYQLQHTWSSGPWTDEGALRTPDASPHRPPPIHQPTPPLQQQPSSRMHHRDSWATAGSSPFAGSPHGAAWQSGRSAGGGGRMEAAMKGTPLYMAPEVLQGGAASPKSDVWSLGCVLYELLALRHPFESRDLATLVMRVSRGQREPLPPHYPRPVQDVINRMLHLDAAQRPTCEEVLTVPCVRAFVELWRTLRAPLDVPGSPSESALERQLAAWQTNVAAAHAKHPDDPRYATVHYASIEHQLLPPASLPSEEREAAERRTAEAATAALLQAVPSASAGSVTSFGAAAAGGISEGTFFYGATGRRMTAAAVVGDAGAEGGYNAGARGEPHGGGVAAGGEELPSLTSAEHRDRAAVLGAELSGMHPTESMRPYMVYDNGNVPSPENGRPPVRPGRRVSIPPTQSPPPALQCAESPKKSSSGASRRRHPHSANTAHHQPASPSFSSFLDPPSPSAPQAGTANNAVGRPGGGKGGAGRRDSPDPLPAPPSAGGPMPSTSPPPPLRAAAGLKPLRTAGVTPLPPTVDEEVLFFKLYHNVRDMRYAPVAVIAEAVVELRQRVQQRMRHQRVLLDIEQLHSRHGSAPLHSMPNTLNVLATAALADGGGGGTDEGSGGARDGSHSPATTATAAPPPEEVYAHMVRQIQSERAERQRQQRATPLRHRQLRDVAAAEARRRRAQREYSASPTHDAGASATTLPFADPTAPLRMSSGATHDDVALRQRWHRYVERRNKISEALTHVFDPVTLRAVYAYYCSCAVLERDATLVRRLVPDRAQWAALPSIEELVVLDRRLLPLMES